MLLVPAQNGCIFMVIKTPHILSIEEPTGAYIARTRSSFLKTPFLDRQNVYKAFSIWLFGGKNQIFFLQTIF